MRLPLGSVREFVRGLALPKLANGLCDAARCLFDIVSVVGAAKAEPHR